MPADRHELRLTEQKKHLDNESVGPCANVQGTYIYIYARPHIDIYIIYILHTYIYICIFVAWTFSVLFDGRLRCILDPQPQTLDHKPKSLNSEFQNALL